MANINIKSNLELIDGSEFNIGEAEAAISLNPSFQWAKIIITDDVANANKHRIPQEEFPNLMKSGIFAPIKMKEGEISPGHAEAAGKAIGTITQIVQSANKLIALAALWKRERPEDVELLKKMFVDKNPPNVSWEISYAESSEEEDGNIALKGTSLNALVVVSNPAYQGRTPFVAMASENLEAKSVEELETLKEEIKSLKDQIAQLESDLQAKEDELTPLREFKASIEAEQARKEKLAKIKERFVEAGLEKDETFWEEKASLLLGLEDEALEFMIQEMVSFSSLAEASNKSPEVPNVKGKSVEKLSPAALGKALRESNLKNK